MSKGKFTKDDAARNEERISTIEKNFR